MRVTELHVAVKPETVKLRFCRRYDFTKSTSAMARAGLRAGRHHAAGDRRHRQRGQFHADGRRRSRWRHPSRRRPGHPRGVQQDRRRARPSAAGRSRPPPADACPPRFVIHTVGPIWRGGMHGEPALLASAYRNSLRLADRLGLHSVRSRRFPPASTAIRHRPAAEIAIEAVWTRSSEARTRPRGRFVLFDRARLTYFWSGARCRSRRQKVHLQHVLVPLTHAGLKE